MRVSLVVLVLALFGAGCSTVLKPTRPSAAIVDDAGDAAAQAAVRFDGDDVQLREPGMPLSTSRAWQREVGNYTATSLNKLVHTDDNAPVARTIVTFDLASPGAFQLGIWKEMSIGLSTTLPDGRIVKSETTTAHIDDPFEYAIVSGLGIGGSALDVVAGISSVLFVLAQSPLSGIVFVGALVGGLAMNLGQSGAQFVVAGNEERRWSDLYATALRRHADDVKRALASPPSSSGKAATAPASSSTRGAPADPADPSGPPPLLQPPGRDPAGP